MGNMAIVVSGLSKKYTLGKTRPLYDTFRDRFTNAVKEHLIRKFGRAESESNNDPLWALKDVSFEVKHGDIVGIIGRNGAGKSTLLKILCRITEPTTGYADINGRVGALLEVGTGFHTELTGRENIYLNGAILGMSRADISSKLDEIIAFAEVEKFIDTPIKYYSSGMVLRLGFAVAAYLNPEIFVIDEVLAVGDLAFQKKCLGKMQEAATQGRTVLFVSHNMAAVSALCTKGILLLNGKIVYTGEVNKVIDAYVRKCAEDTIIPLSERFDRRGNGRLRFTKVSFQDEDGRGIGSGVSGKPLQIVLEYESANGYQARNVDAFIEFFGTFGELLFVCHVRAARGAFEGVPPQGQMICAIPRLPLTSGSYRLAIEMGIAPDCLLDRIDDAAVLYVEAGDFHGSGYLPLRNHAKAVMIEHHWEVFPTPADEANPRRNFTASAFSTLMLSAWL